MTRPAGARSARRRQKGGAALLDGVRVVDLTEGIAGAYAAKLLADQGARVTKVEAPDGDPLRHWSAATPDEPVDGTGPLYAFLHARTDALVGADDAPGVDAALATADLVLVGDDAGLLAGRDHHASVVTLSHFGGDGPLAGAPGDEFTLQAWCGLMSGCGTRDTPPLQMGIGHGLWATGAVGALGALAARTWQVRTGRPTAIEVTALEVMAVVLNNYPSLYCHFTGNVAMMSRGGDWPQIVRCKDGWIGLCVFTPQQWADFAGMIGRDDLAADERLNSMGGRGRNRELAQSVVRPWVEQHTAAEIHELGGLFRVPVAFVGNGRDVLDMSHFVERGVFEEHDGFRAPRPPLRVDTMPAPPPDARRRDGDAPIDPTDAGARPLDGVRVVDLTAFWAGPAATHLLATLGADVVKIESPTRPDGMRFATTRPPTDADWMEYGPTFHGTNPGKRSVTVDFSVPEGCELVLRLVEQADVVVENFTPRVLANVGLDDDVLRARRPDLVLLRMPAFGLDGPWRDHSGFAQTTEQVSGIAWLTGTADIDPQVRSTVDPIAGIHGAFAVLAALDHRRRTGEGARLELPMAEVALNVAAEPVITWSASGTLLERDGNRSPRGAPQGAYACAGDDRWVALTVGSDDEWRRLVDVLGSPSWATTPELATRHGRRARHDDVDRELAQWFATRERDDVVAALVAAGVHAAPVWDQNRQHELPQLAARGFTQPLEHPIVGTVGHPGTGLRAAGFDLRYRSHAPTVGEHTAEVLRDVLGLDDGEIAGVAARGVTAPG
jgi:crotonobetainyl-CoA:carnitine CoA-transferase CaiB-like acyl-CoA transferase